MEIGHGQKVLRPGLLPAYTFESLALRTVPVSAGVERDLLIPAAVIALPEVAPEHRRATARDRGDDAPLLRAQATKL